MPVITISRQLGSGGLYIAHQLAQKLQLRYIDKELIAKVAQMAKVSEDQIEKFDQEEFDQVKVLFSETAFPIPGSGMIYPFAAAGYMEPYWFPVAVGEPGGFDDRKYLQLTQTVIQNFAEEGNVVIMGRGGSILLKDFPGAVHLRFVAPLEKRIEWGVQEEPSIDKNKAKEIIEKKDKIRAEYIKHFYHADWDDPLLYHFIINTGQVTLDDAVEIVKGLVNRLDK